MQRNHYFDFLRGIAIMMVVAIHTFSIAETDIQHNILDVNALVRNVLNCAVPIFLAISGYFLCSKKLDTWADRRAFWRKQMPKVYVPTIIVSLPYLALALRHGSNPLTAVAMMLVCGFSIYYFIALILQYYALLPVFKKTNMGGVILGASISIASILTVTYITQIQGRALPLIVYAGPFPVWCVFFAMGSYLRKCERTYSLLLPILMVIAGLALEYAETYYLNTNYKGGFGIKCSAFVYSMAVITLLFSYRLEQAYKRNKVTRTIEYIGSISFAVYLYHLYGNEVLNILHATTAFPWILRWVLCLVATVLAIELLKRILPQKYHWLLGV